MEKLLESWQSRQKGEELAGVSFYIKWKAKNQQNMVNIVTVTPCYTLTGKARTFMGDMIGYLWRPSELHIFFSYGQWESCDNISNLLSNVMCQAPC